MDKTDIHFLDKGPNHALHVEATDGWYGLFYGSADGERHVAFYVPYQDPPREVLCGKYAGFLTSTRCQANYCNACLEQLRRKLYTPSEVPSERV